MTSVWRRKYQGWEEENVQAEEKGRGFFFGVKTFSPSAGQGVVLYLEKFFLFFLSRNGRGGGFFRQAPVAMTENE